jgi:glutathione synthase/RimK-type ligase-like ATP-grasp enzyme
MRIRHARFPIFLPKRALRSGGAAVSIETSFRLALATSAELAGIHPDEVHLADSLRALGVEPTSCTWTDPAVDWSRFDAVLIRTTWDYFQRYREFLQWLDRLPVPTINPTPLLRWNSDKRYLLELERRGIAVIPSRIAAAGQLRALLATMPGQDVVVKPTVSGGAWLTVRGVVGDEGFANAIAQLPPDLDYLVQPFVPAIVDDGEWSLVFFDNRYSHAVIKRPARGDYRVQDQFGGRAEPVEPDASMLAAAQRALAAVADLGHPDHAYVRVDGVQVDGQFQLMELEMIEPGLHLARRPDAAERFARNLLARLQAMARVREPSA